MRRARVSGAQPEVLMVTPSFFGYEHSIADEMRRRGARVTVLDERPSNGSLAKAAARVAPRLLGPLTRRHYRRATAQLRDRSLDMVLVIKAEVVPETFLDELRRNNPGCTFVFYAFDSFANSPRGERLLDRFDHAFSFDRDDVERLDRLEYKPLFYSPEFEPGPPTPQRRYDLAFVGTVHSDRYAVCQALAPAGETNRFFFYSPARWHHAWTLIRDRSLRAIPWSDVSFKKLARAEVAAIFADARAVVDVQRTRQSGLTMRTFEVLAAGSKLITSNDRVRLEPFYDPSRVLVMPPERTAWDVERVRQFIARDVPTTFEPILDHSLERWVDDLWQLQGTSA